jgi:hypothetical protein
VTRSRSACACSSVSSGLVKNEPGAAGVGVGGVEDHALAAAQASTASRTSDSGARSPDLHPEAPGQLGVADGRRQLAGAEVERHGQHDPPVRLGLERAVPVAEAAVLRAQLHDLARGPVVRPHRDDGLRDVLAVRPDVLHDAGADEPGDAGQRLDADEPVGDAEPDEGLPLLPGAAVSSTRSPRCSAARPWTATRRTVPSTPSSGRTTLLPPPSTSSRSPSSSARRTTATTDASS